MSNLLRAGPLLMAAALLFSGQGAALAQDAGCAQCGSNFANCQGKCGHGCPCPPFFKWYSEGPPKICIKCACPRPVCDPCKMEHFGYYQTCWAPWPYPPDWSHCPTPPPGAVLPPPPYPPYTPRTPREQRDPRYADPRDAELPAPNALPNNNTPPVAPLPAPVPKAGLSPTAHLTNIAPYEEAIRPAVPAPAPQLPNRIRLVSPGN